jgi:hypothetical protein
MRIFVSSSFEDLKEHRAAAIRVLRQLGHQVLAMEDMTAGTSAPLSKVLEMVDRSEAYVGIFAWRYGYSPKQAAPAAPAVRIPTVSGATPGETSITHYEYLHAVERGLPIIAFLLDEQYPWPPQLIDGFDATRAGAQPNADKIRALRLSLQQERVVSWFTTPADLEARVSAAVTTAGLASQLDLQPALLPVSQSGVASDSILEQGIAQAIIGAGDDQHALKIDLATTWWSTRLYLIASLAQRLTEARRIVVVDTRPLAAPSISGPSSTGATQAFGERFIGQLSTDAVLSVIGPKWKELQAFEQSVRARPLDYSDVGAEISALIAAWTSAFPHEQIAKVDLTPEVLRRWFGDAMLTQPLEIADLRRASAVDILRLLDYPNDFVPVLTRPETREGAPAMQRVDVVDKMALNARLARSYLVELLDRARIV